jgi:hypothetical protein
MTINYFEAGAPKNTKPKLCPAVEKLKIEQDCNCDECCKNGSVILGATLQREHDLKEFERIIIEYFGKEGDGKTMLESLRGKI